MSFSQIFSKIRQHLKYSDFYKCTFATWDSKQKRFVIKPGKRHTFLVTTSIALHFVHVVAQIFSIFTKSTSLIDVAEASGMSMLYIGVLILRLDFDVDYVPVQLLNYIHVHCNGKYLFIICLI
jgi:hypothetical protein